MLNGLILLAFIPAVAATATLVGDVLPAHAVREKLLRDRMHGIRLAGVKCGGGLSARLVV